MDEDPSQPPRWMCKMREYKRWKKSKFRPIPISMRESTNITLQDIQICDSPLYGVGMTGCEHIRIQSIDILSDPGCPNADGIHFSSCRNIFINGCYFRCGDDCIAIDSNYGTPSENAVISDCIFFTSVSMFRIFTGLEPAIDASERTPLEHERFSKGLVRNICISNCVSEKSACGFNITADSGTIDGVYINNITGDINDMDSPFFHNYNGWGASSVT